MSEADREDRFTIRAYCQADYHSRKRHNDDYYYNQVLSDDQCIHAYDEFNNTISVSMGHECHARNEDNVPFTGVCMLIQKVQLLGQDMLHRDAYQRSTLTK